MSCLRVAVVAVSAARLARWHYEPSHGYSCPSAIRAYGPRLAVRAFAVWSSVRGRHGLAAPTAWVADRVWTVRRSLPGGVAARSQCRLVAKHDVCRVCRRTTLAPVGLQTPLEKLLEHPRNAAHHLRSGLGPGLGVDYTV